MLTAVAVVLVAATVTAAPARAAGVGATPVATGLAFPAAFTFAPDGRIFYGERFTGQVRILSAGSNTHFFTVPDLIASGEQGVLGIAVDPAYPAMPFVYIYATRTVAGATVNQIVRVSDSGGVGTGMTVIFQAPASGSHNGGRILFRPGTRLLHAVVGDRRAPAKSQQLASVNGKLLRMKASGAVPPGNPFGNLVWAYGIRNSYGFAFDPQAGSLWETENGPECNDELNLLSEGRNYGWGPNQTCSSPPPPPLNTNQDGPSPVLPSAFYSPPTAPTGVAFCAGCGLGGSTEGHLFYGTFNTRQIREVTLDATRRAVAAEAVAYTHGSGILSLERAPDGALHFSDGSGIYRLTPT